MIMPHKDLNHGSLKLKASVLPTTFADPFDNLNKFRLFNCFKIKTKEIINF